MTVILGYINETDLKTDLVLAWKSIICYLDYLLSAGWSMGSCPKRLNHFQSISDGSGDYQQYTCYEIIKSLFSQITANTIVAYFSWTTNLIIRRSSVLNWYLHVRAASLHVSSEHRMGKWTHLFQDKAKRLRDLLLPVSAGIMSHSNRQNKLIRPAFLGTVRQETLGQPCIWSGDISFLFK